MYFRYEGLEILNTVITPYEMFKKLNVFLVRHGESVSNALRKKFKEEGKVIDEDQKMEDAKIKLTEKGILQSKEVGKLLANHLNLTSPREISETLVLVSPYERTRETFEHANTFLQFDYNSDNVFVLNDLREQFYGAFNMIDREIKRKNYGKLYDECQKTTLSFFKPQLLGESPADVSARLDSVFNFIEKITTQQNIKNIIIFGHRNVNKCMLMKILNLPAEFYDDFEYDENASIINVKYGKYNDIDFDNQ